MVLPVLGQLPWLPVLNNIPPPHLRIQSMLLREYRRAISNSKISLHHDITVAPINRLKSRKPFISKARQIDASNFEISEYWKRGWHESGYESAIFDLESRLHTDKEFSLPRNNLPYRNTLSVEIRSKLPITSLSTVQYYRTEVTLSKSKILKNNQLFGLMA